jgi:hypothetical protein
LLQIPVDSCFLRTRGEHLPLASSVMAKPRQAPSKRLSRASVEE